MKTIIIIYMYFNPQQEFKTENNKQTSKNGAR